MEATAQGEPDPVWGTVSVEDLGEQDSEVEAAQAGRVTAGESLYIWRPGPTIAGELPAGFSIKVRCLRAADGRRLILPCDGSESLVLNASVGGCAIRAEIDNSSQHQRFSFHIMRLLFRRAPRLREFLARGFKSLSDLHVVKACRGSMADANVLPAGVGLDMSGQFTARVVSELVRQGREQALEVGDQSPAKEKCIRLGLLQAARSDPFDPARLSEMEARQLVRLALFDLGPAQEPVDELLYKRVMARLLEILERHIDDSPETFERFFITNADDFVHQIAKKAQPDGPIPRPLVRQALLEATFQAFFYVGECVRVQMWAFRRFLNEDEQALFDLLYGNQPCLGGLPLIILHDRFGYLREVLVELFDRPRDDHWLGVLLRMLAYYGEMAGNRRAADREYKRQRQHRNVIGRTAQKIELGHERPSSGGTSDFFQDIAEHLFELQGWTCPCRTSSHWSASLVSEVPMDREVVLRMDCGHCGGNQTTRVSLERFVEIARQLKSAW